MESVRRGRQWVWVVSVLFAVLALAQARKPSVVEETDMMHLSSDIYNDGPLKVDLYTVYSSGLSKVGYRKSRGSERTKLTSFTEIKLANEPPRPLLIATPEEAGEYPVVVFQHGFTLKNTFYSQLLKHVASYGFIAVSPQMYLFAGSDATEEICTAAAIIDWFPAGLAEALSKRVKSVKPDLDKLALAGHSRGGKVVFGLATGVCKTALNFSAIAGLDPVDGTGVEQQTKPPILQFSQHSLKLGMPTLIVGAGLGNVKRNIFFPACAPEGVSHEAFFYDCDGPSFHFVALEYGHMDFLDDDTGGIQGVLSYCVCKNGNSREPMRRFAGGVLVAFLEASLKQDSTQLSNALENPSEAPVKQKQPESYGSIADLAARQ